MLELIQYIVNQFAEDKENVEYEVNEKERVIEIVVTLPSSDMGKVIGKQGKIAKAMPQYGEPSKFPSVTADLSYLIASEVPYSAFQSMVETLELPYLESYELVGIYQDPAWKRQKSVTIRFVFCSQERTLESEEVQTLVNRLIEAGEKMGAQVKDN